MSRQEFLKRDSKAVPTTSSERRPGRHESFVSFGLSVFYTGHHMRWLILRGLVREQRHWGEFPTHMRNALREFDPEVEVHMLDFPGFGTESERRSPFSIGEIVDDVRNRWKTIASDGQKPCYLLAISLGGMVAMNWVSRHPEDFKGLVLINSSATGFSPVTKRLKPQNYPKLLSLFSSGDVGIRERKILEMTTNLSGERLRVLSERHAGFAKKVRKTDAIAQIISAIRFRPPSRLGIPLMVLGAKGDRLVDVSCSEQIARRFQGHLELHETANHDLATDDGDWIIAKLREWIPSAG